MDADGARTAPAGPAHTWGGQATSGWSVALALGALLATGLLSGCGMSSNRELPDLASRKEPADGRKPLSSAEQKKAIDSLIARRDAHSQGQGEEK